MSDSPSNPLSLYEERALQAGAVLPGFVAAAIILAARADPTKPEGQRWDSYTIRGGVPTTLALAAQLITDMPAYLINGPQHLQPEASQFKPDQASYLNMSGQNPPPNLTVVRGFEGTTLPPNAVEVLGVHLSKGLNASWVNLQEVFTRVCIVGAIIDASRTFTFIRVWQPATVPDARSMGQLAVFAEWAIANILAKTMRPHFAQSIATRVFEGLPGSLDSIDGG